MASVVAAFGVPHTPAFPSLVARDGPDCDVARLYGTIRDHLEEVAPDLLVVFTTDHLNTFFFDAWPTLAIGVADSFPGPSDRPPAMEDVVIASDAAFAAHLRTQAVLAGFDVTLANGISVDHATMVPLHFLTPAMTVPTVPVFINGHLPPMPSAARCYAFGQVLGRAINDWPAESRVAVLGSGSFSLEVHGPLMEPDLPFGVPAPAWAQRVHDLLEVGDTETLIAEASPERFATSGNVAGELLNWIAMLGTIGGGRPRCLLPQLRYGHGYGVWRTEP